MPEMSPVELAHSQIVNRFLMPEGGTPCARGIVSAIAVGVTPDDDGCGERPHIFIDAAAASCEKEAVVREAAELAKPFVPSVLRFGPFEGLQAGLGAGIAPVAANRYNIPPATAGTYGATFQVNSRWYLLGSNHVLGNNGRTPQGTPVCEPGPIDALNGGKPIAAYRGCVPLIASAANAADCAWAELSAPPSPANPPEVTTVAATSGMQVAKTGRSTRTTTSRIR
ncbi:MAG TPA: hypothetical protein VGS58_01710, partial [Candidatus Sulfopaludibacter sp.]|nr:hypothetical protein [Candidatus Sulfopaludibacter sp.]